MLTQISIGASTAVVGYDLMRDSTQRTAGYPRVLRGIALKGSAAALDTEIQVMVGQVEVARLFNSGTGAPNRDDLFIVGSPIGPNQPLYCKIVDAPATNPINLTVELT